MYLKNRRKARVLEPGKGEKKRGALQLEMWTDPVVLFVCFVFAGHVKHFGFYSKYIGKALEDF